MEQFDEKVIATVMCTAMTSHAYYSVKCWASARPCPPSKSCPYLKNEGLDVNSSQFSSQNTSVSQTAGRQGLGTGSIAGGLHLAAVTLLQYCSLFSS